MLKTALLKPSCGLSVKYEVDFLDLLLLSGYITKYLPASFWKKIFSTYNKYCSQAHMCEIGKQIFKGHEQPLCLRSCLFYCFLLKLYFSYN